MENAFITLHRTVSSKTIKQSFCVWTSESKLPWSCAVIRVTLQNRGGNRAVFPCNSKPFQQNETLLILNLDGVPIFKSRKFNVWPLWLQCANLPPKFRSSFHNISLLGLGHGLQKPEWNQILMRLKFELDILQQFHMDTNLGCICKCKKALLVCDTPVKTAGLNMNHFNGFLWLHTLSSDWLSRGS